MTREQLISLIKSETSIGFLKDIAVAAIDSLPSGFASGLINDLYIDRVYDGPVYTAINIRSGAEYRFAGVADAIAFFKDISPRFSRTVLQRARDRGGVTVFGYQLTYSNKKERI